MRLKLSDLLPGSEYEIQLRTNDGGAFSEWSRSFTIDTIGDNIPPAAPVGLTWEVSGTSFIAKWDEVTLNSDLTAMKDFSHYEVHLTNDIDEVFYKTNSLRFDFPFELHYSAFNTITGTVKVRVRAVDDSHNPSAWSTQLSASNPPPAPPTNFVADGISNAIVLTWDEVDENDLKAYSVHLSTTDPAFTPGLANRVWYGRSTGITIPSTSYSSDHYFKLASVDIFNTPSTYVEADARPESPFGGDSTPPGQPTSIAVSGALNAEDSGRADFTITWTDPVDGDLSEIAIRYREQGETIYQFASVPVGEQQYIAKYLRTNTTYEFQLAAIDFSSNYSAWTTTVTDSESSLAPSKPSPPTVVGGAQNFGVTHDLTKAAGGQLESDVAYINIYVHSANDFSASSFFGNMQVEPGSPVVVSSKLSYSWPAFYETLDLYMWVTAVSRTGLESIESDPEIFNIDALEGTYIADASIGSAKIQSLVANKLTAGTGIIANLEVKSTLTIGSSVDSGSIQSYEYDNTAGASGYSLQDTGLIIKSGQIEAEALRLQNSQNLMPAAYAGFEFISSYYSNDKFIIPASTVIDIVGTPVRYGDRALSITSSSTTTRTLDLAPSGEYNIDVEEGVSYIVSAWIYNSLTSDKTVALRISWNDATTSSGTSVIIPAESWMRISHVAAAPVGASKARAGITYGYGDSSSTFIVDAVQFEAKVTGSDTPSHWSPPGATRIDGGIVRTGEIRSSQTVTVNGVEQPLWSINVEGAAQFGDANVRGSLIVGEIGDPDNGQSLIRSGNYSAGSAGYIFKSDGSAELNNVTARGNIESSSLIVKNPTWNNGVEITTDWQSTVGYGQMAFQTGNVDQRGPGQIISGHNGTLNHGEIILVPPEVGSTSNRSYARLTVAGPNLSSGGTLYQPIWTGSAGRDYYGGTFLRQDGVSTRRGVLSVGALSDSTMDIYIDQEGSIDAPLMRPIMDHSGATDDITWTTWESFGSAIGFIFVAPASGAVRIDSWWSMSIFGLSSGQSNQIWGSYRVGTGSTVDSGTQILSPSTVRGVSLRVESTGDFRTNASDFYFLDGLTPGNTYNIITYTNKANTNGTARNYARRIMVTAAM